MKPRNTCQADNDQDSQTTRSVNVTDLMPNQRRQLLINCMSQRGFKAFNKHQDKQNNHTYYTFHYQI